MSRQNSLGTRNRRRPRRMIGARENAGGFNRPPHRVVKASRRTYLTLYAPRALLTQIKSKSYWRAARPKFLAGLLIVLFGLGLYQLFANDQFYVPQLALAGNHILPAVAIEQAAGIRGWNIFFVNRGDVEAAIKRLPEVKDARVLLGLPNHVEVQIVERGPPLCLANADRYELGGRRWNRFTGAIQLPDLLTMKDLDSADTKIGTRVNAEAFNAAVNLRNTWQDGPRAFEWSKAHGLTARDAHGWLIYFGTASQMANKVAALKIVTAQLIKEKHTIAYIDVGSGLPYYQEIAAKQ